VLGAVAGGSVPGRPRLFAQNDRHLSATFDERFKLVDAPLDNGKTETVLYDRQGDPGEIRDARAREPEAFRVARRELDLFLDRANREWAKTKELVLGKKGDQPPTSAGCELLRSMGYVDRCP
jgi:hypothetical protein